MSEFTRDGFETARVLEVELHIREAAVLAHVSVTRIQRWIKSGQLSVVRRPGGFIRVSPLALERCLIHEEMSRS